MDPSGRITGVAMRDKGAIEDSRNKVLSVFDWKVKGVEAVVKTGTSGKDWGKCWTQDMVGVEDDRYKKIKIFLWQENVMVVI